MGKLFIFFFHLLKHIINIILFFFFFNTLLSCLPWGTFCSIFFFFFGCLFFVLLLFGQILKYRKKQISQSLIWAYYTAMLLSYVLRPKALLARCIKLLPIFPGGRSLLPKFLGQLGPLGYSSPNISRAMPHRKFKKNFFVIPLTVYIQSTELYRSQFMCYILLLATGV